MMNLGLWRAGEDMVVVNVNGGGFSLQINGSVDIADGKKVRFKGGEEKR